MEGEGEYMENGSGAVAQGSGVWVGDLAMGRRRTRESGGWGVQQHKCCAGTVIGEGVTKCWWCWICSCSQAPESSSNRL